MKQNMKHRSGWTAAAAATAAAAVAEIREIV